MNNRLNFIFSRRSIRKYQKREIPDDVINDILEAAMAVPSAMTRDPWHFIVITSRDTLNTVAEILPNGQMLRNAGAGIIICGDMKQAHSQSESYMLQDCAASIQNILLAASALGLGACWLGMHPRADRITGIKTIFSLPEHIIPVSGVSLGWPDEKKEPRTRFDEAKIHREKW